MLASALFHVNALKFNLQQTAVIGVMPGFKHPHIGNVVFFWVLGLEVFTRGARKWSTDRVSTVATVVDLYVSISFLC